ncbi:MAG: hypothetical protein J0L94_10525 [Rhodothermia bacterium]|nr:hypothetical protein [Rhodothermia bacterium]
MTILHQLKADLTTATQPILRPLSKTAQTKVVAIGFVEGMVLKKHKAPAPARLFVLEGRVRYSSKTGDFDLGQYDQIDIPVGEFHEVSALENAFCLLIIGI